MILTVVVQPNSEQILTKDSSEHHRKPILIAQLVDISRKITIFGVPLHLVNALFYFQSI
jgi:hypothetical protein